MLHYNPRHVSSGTMPIFRRTNCIITAFGL